MTERGPDNGAQDFMAEAEEARRETLMRLLMRDAGPIVAKFDGADAIQAETVIKSLIERAYDGGAEHAMTLPEALTHEPRHRKPDEGDNDE